MRRSTLFAAAAFALVSCAQPARAPEAPAPVAGLPEPLLPLAAEGNVGDLLACLRGRGVTIASAHRGGPMQGFPENAIETMANRLAEAPVMLEIDVRQSADGTYVLFHDNELDADTDGTGPVSSMTLEQLRALRYDEGGTRISTLEEVIDWAKGRAILQLDIKPGVDFEPLLEWLHARGAEDRALIITYNVRDAATVARASEFLISASVNKEADLAALVAAGVPASRITAWTGLQAPRPDLWRFLGEKGVSANYATYSTLDEQDGSAEAYAALAGAGLHILSSDRPTFAFRALEARQDFGAAAKACMG